MKRKPRIYYSDSQKAMMWERWRQGDSLQKIAQLFDRNHLSVERILAETGGICPAQRSRSRLSLSLAEREEISRAVATGQSVRSIAAALKRAPSTVSREIKRNGGVQAYRANLADQRAWDRARRPKPCKLVMNRKLADVVASRVELEWSPEQIAGWLKQAFASDEDFHVSHETIAASAMPICRKPSAKARRSCGRSLASDSRQPRRLGLHAVRLAFHVESLLVFAIALGDEALAHGRI